MARKRKWQKPRSSPAASVIIAAYRERGAMTIDECRQVTGLHTERIRRVVKRPQFVPVGIAGTVPPARVWELRKE